MDSTITSPFSAHTPNSGKSGGIRIYWVILGVAVIFGFWIIVSYNVLVRSNTAIAMRWTQVEMHHQRRLDLVSELVESVKGTLKQEKQEQEVFMAIANTKQEYANATTIDKKVTAMRGFESSFDRLLVMIENHSQLKSDTNVQSLIVALKDGAQAMSVERSRFNDAVHAYNLRVQNFPSSMFAGMFGFQQKSIL